MNMEQLILHLKELENIKPEIQEHEPILIEQNLDYDQELRKFIDNLNSEDVGQEKIGPYSIHYEGFSEWCQQDANDRCYLPKDDPRYLEKYEDIYEEVLRDFINREDGKMPLTHGLVGDRDYPVFYAIFTDEDKLTESSPNTLEGSFSQDLTDSKEWLCDILAKGLKNKNPGTIFVLGSWYGNIGIFLEKYNINFDKLVLVDKDEETLLKSKEVLNDINEQGKLVLLHQDVNDIVFDEPCIVINTSCNETGPNFLSNVPNNVLLVLQARNNINELINTDNINEFDSMFPIRKTYYLNEIDLEDIETKYKRFMKIGRK
jgi:hypothetical protein